MRGFPKQAAQPAIRGASLRSSGGLTLGDLSGAPEPYVSLYYTAAQMEAYHTRYTDGSYSQDWLTNQYNFYMARSATQLASSTPSSAAISIDAAGDGSPLDDVTERFFKK